MGFLKQTLFVTITIILLNSVQNCEHGSNWISFENSCYQLISDSKDWTSAQSFCRNIGANLASVHSDRETDFILRSINSDSNIRRYNTVWIGLHALNIRDNFEWNDGSELDYRNWNSGEPNNDLNMPEDCGQLITRNGFWNDAPCSGKMGFVCKQISPTAKSSANVKRSSPSKNHDSELSHSTKLSTGATAGIVLGCLLLRAIFQ
uniref:U36-Liphistoxin-Lth1b_1 n=2 Tax=Liphistius TaxID=62150 RepID=A0A4Q8K218_9ARAC